MTKNAFLWHVWPGEMVMDLSSACPHYQGPNSKDLRDKRHKESPLFLHLSTPTWVINSHPLQAHSVTQGVKGSSCESSPNNYLPYLPVVNQALQTIINVVEFLKNNSLFDSEE